VRKSSATIDEIVREIADLQLIEHDDFPPGQIMDVAELFEQMEKLRTSRLAKVVEHYESVTQNLMKVEEIVSSTDTGCDPVMEGFYLYWERKFHNAVVTMILTAMARFHGLLNIILRTDSGGEGSHDGPVRLPIVRVRASMNGAEVTISPALPEVYNHLRKAATHLIDSSKAFVRWMRGSCTLCQPIYPNGDDEQEPVVFSFYQDISQSPQVIKMMLTLNHSIHHVFSLANKYMHSWRRYNDVYQLWDNKRRAGLDKLVELAPSCMYFETRLATYTRLAAAVRAQPRVKDIDFLRIECAAVVVAIEERALLWRNDYGAILAELSRAKLQVSLWKKR